MLALLLVLEKLPELLVTGAEVEVVLLIVEEEVSVSNISLKFKKES